MLSQSDVSRWKYRNIQRRRLVRILPLAVLFDSCIFLKDLKLSHNSGKSQQCVIPKAFLAPMSLPCPAKASPGHICLEPLEPVLLTAVWTYRNHTEMPSLAPGKGIPIPPIAVPVLQWHLLRDETLLPHCPQSCLWQWWHWTNSSNFQCCYNIIIQPASPSEILLSACFKHRSSLSPKAKTEYYKITLFF